MDSTVSETDTKTTKSQNVTQIIEQNFFEHDTGDTYEGYIIAKKKDKAFQMKGFGVYTTAEGDTYTGIWDSDKLGCDEPVTIVYKDGKYEGSFKDWAYNGLGTYTYPDDSMLLMNFVNNIPVGVMTLIDPNGHRWLGAAEYGFGWVEPVNHYYEALQGDSKRSHKSGMVDHAKVKKK